jgi:2-polyprenyl-3-methyl-5-hydroxy-6-metoxy-1,4-benzoquinol methylase
MHSARTGRWFTVGRVTDYRAVNRANWDDRAQAHAASADYNVGEFTTDPAHLSDVVRFDLPLLGDISGLRGVHLQCHIGTDTLSLARLGARMTGVDFSTKSLEQARALAEQAGPAIDYLESDVYTAAAVLDRSSYDLVYTGIGALCWLPDIKRWAQTVAALLKPGGRLFIREGHPILWSLEYERPDSLLVLDVPYFEQVEPQIYDEAGTYVQTDAEFTHNVTHEWNHGIGEIVTAVLEAGLALTGLVEHTTVPWEALPGQMHRVANGEWQLKDRPERLPHTYTLQAVRSGGENAV